MKKVVKENIIKEIEGEDIGVASENAVRYLEAPIEVTLRLIAS